MAALITLFQVTAKNSSTATSIGVVTRRCAVDIEAPAPDDDRSVTAENIRSLQARAIHFRRRLYGYRASVWIELSAERFGKQIERALGRAHLGMAMRR